MRREIERDVHGNPVRTPETGRTRVHVTFTQDDIAQGIHPFLTGPTIDGMVQLPTGAEYDVSDAVIAVPLEHHKALQRAIHAEHHRRGQFLDHPITEDDE